jgi:hypothetical protein
VSSAALAAQLPLVNQVLVLWNVMTRGRLFPPADVPDIADVLFSVLVEAVPTARNDAELRWSERTVQWMECVHHVTEILRTLLDFRAADIAADVMQFFRAGVSRGEMISSGASDDSFNPLPIQAAGGADGSGGPGNEEDEEEEDDDRDEVEAVGGDAHRQTVSTAQLIIARIRAAWSGDTLCRADTIEKLFTLSMYQHTSLPTDTVNLVMQMLCPSRHVGDFLSNKVFSFADRGDVPKFHALVRTLQHCRAELAQHALPVEASDAATRRRRSAALTQAASAVITLVRELPPRLRVNARNMMLGFGIHVDLLARIDATENMTNVTLDGVEQHLGAALLSVARLLTVFAAADRHNATVLLRSFSSIARFTDSSPILRSKDFAALLAAMLAWPTAIEVDAATLVDDMVGDLQALSPAHVEVLQLLLDHTPAPTRRHLRTSVATAMGAVGDITALKLRDRDGAILPKVVRLIAFKPQNADEAESMATALPLWSLVGAAARVIEDAEDGDGEDEAVHFLEAAYAIHFSDARHDSSAALEHVTATMAEVVVVRDAIFPYVGRRLFAVPEFKATPADAHRAVLRAATAATFSSVMLSMPSVAPFKRLLGGAVGKLAAELHAFVRDVLGRFAVAVDPTSAANFAECVAVLDVFLRPAVLPSSAAVTLALENHALVLRAPAADAEAADDDAALDALRQDTSVAMAEPRKIIVAWMSVCRRLTAAFAAPTDAELAPLTALQSDGASPAVLVTTIHHLHHSQLTDPNTVSLLRSLTCLLTQASGRSDVELTAVQNRLNALNATPLVSVLLERPSFVVVQHAVQFGIALLEGGNKAVQDGLLGYFSSHDEKFFVTMRRFLKSAELAIMRRGRMGTFHGRLLDKHAADSTALTVSLLRLLQLLCEGHHLEFQNYLRHQHDNFNSYNMCVTVMEILHCLVLFPDSTTAVAGIQALNTLTELCQGPCQLNQSAIVGSNFVAEANSILQFADDRSGQDEEFKKAAIVCLAALLEGAQDAAIPNLILSNLQLDGVQRLLTDAFTNNDRMSEEEAVAFEVYVLVGALAMQADKLKLEPLRRMLAGTPGHAYFNGCMCAIEIWRDDDPANQRLETIFFRRPDICRLRDEAKQHLLTTVNRSSIVTKHSDFFRKSDDVIFQMECQSALELNAARFPKWVNVGGWLQARSAPFEAALLLMGFVSSTLMVLGLITRDEAPSWAASATFAVIGAGSLVCSAYLVAVQFVLDTPLAAHRNRTAAEKKLDDPFVGLTIREKISTVATKRNLLIVLADNATRMFLFCAVVSLLGIARSPFFLALLLLQVIHMFPLLGSIVKAISRNAKPLMLTFFLGIITVYFFAVYAYLFLHQHFPRPDGGGTHCDTLLQCFSFQVSKGFKGGGISDDMSPNDWYEQHTYFTRELFEMAFFIFIGVIVMNIVFALIVDTFAELRDEKKTMEEDMRTSCFICGIDSSTFDRQGEGFVGHTKGSHNMWQYLYFMHHLRRKDHTEFSGQESYVYEKMSRTDLSFFPVNRSGSLAQHQEADEAEGPQGGVDAAELRRTVDSAVEQQLRDFLPKIKDAVAPAGGAELSSMSAAGSASFRRRGSMAMGTRQRSILPQRRSTDAVDQDDALAATNSQTIRFNLGDAPLTTSMSIGELAPQKPPPPPPPLPSLSAELADVRRMKQTAQELLLRLKQQALISQEAAL